MAELTIQALQWSAQHGHPVLALRVCDSERYFVVAMSPEDAAALAPYSSRAGTTGKDRLLTLVESTIASLEARLVGVSLAVGRDFVLRSSLRLANKDGEREVAAHFADGIALAHRARLPLAMAESDLQRVPLGPVPRPASDETTLDAFRDLIESLDLDGLGGPGSGPSGVRP